MAFPTASLFTRYEAKDETGKTDGQALSTIVDQSGNARDLTSIAGEEPTWQDGVLNGHPVFRFDGTDDFAGRSDGSGTVVSAATISVVAAADVEGSGRDWVYGESRATTQIFALLTDTPTSGEWGGWARSGGVTVQPETSGVDMTVFTVLTLVSDGTNVTLYRDGTQVDQLGFTQGLTLGNGGLGALYDLDSECFDGDIALAACWEVALDATGRADLHSYVQDTYGITVSDYSGGSAVGLSTTVRMG